MQPIPTLKFDKILWSKVPTQYRTEHHTFLFKENGENIKIKVYNAAQERIYRDVRPAPKCSILFLTEELSKDLKLSTVTSVEEILREIQRQIQQIKPKINLESSLAGQFTCPITLEFFQEPVIDNHGHTFEKSAIEEHMAKHTACPINREPIQSLAPNLDIKNYLEDLQKKDPIPTFSLFKYTNRNLADKYIALAKDCEGENEFDSALQAYGDALKYTNCVADYQAIPNLFKEAGQQEKWILASLYLSYYQVQEGNLSDAAATLQELELTYPIVSMLHHLYTLSDQKDKALSVILKAIKEQPDPQRQLALFKLAISADPNQLDLYIPISDLCSSPPEKAHFLYMGACQALQLKKLSQAKNLSNLAKEHHIPSFIDQLIQISTLDQAQKKEELFNELTNLAFNAADVRQSLRLYKLTNAMEDYPDNYSVIADLYDKINNTKQANFWRQKLLTHYIDRKDWSEAENLAMDLLKKMPNEIALYESLQTVYTHWEGKTHKLSNLYAKMGQTYLENKQLDLAEAIYKKAYEEFWQLKHALDLANTLKLQNKIPECVNQYYQAALIASNEECLGDLDVCIREIEANDPRMKSLKPSKQIHIRMLKRIRDLELEVMKLKKDEIGLEREKAYEIKNPEVRFKTFFAIAQKDPQHKLDKVKQAAMAIENDQIRAEAFFEIVKLEAQYDLVQAKQTALTIENVEIRSKAFLEIIKLEAKSDPTQAKQTATFIEDAELSSKVSLDVKRQTALDIIAEAKRIAMTLNDAEQRAGSLSRIVCLEARLDLNKAKQSLATIKNVQPLHSGAYCATVVEIVKIEAQQNLFQARQTAQLTSPGFYRSYAFQEIAKVDPQHDLSEAKAHVRNLESHYMCPIIAIEAEYNLANAKKEAFALKDDFSGSALYNIVKVEAQRDLSQARQTAMAIKGDSQRVAAFIAIAKVGSANDLAEAKNATKVLKDYERVQALATIAKIDPQHDLTEAKQHALAIEHEIQRSNSLLKITCVEAQYDLTQAQKTAMLIPLMRFRARAFIAIAMVDPKHDLTQAKKAAMAIESDIERLSELSDIIRLEVQYDIVQARQTSVVLGNDDLYLSLFAAKMAQDDLTKAKEAAMTIKDNQKRLQTFLEIAKALIDMKEEYTPPWLHLGQILDG